MSWLWLCCQQGFSGWGEERKKKEERDYLQLIYNYNLGSQLLAHIHQQNIPSHIYKYIAIYSNKVIVNLKIQAAKYLQIQATSNTQSTTRNVYSTIHATVYKVLHKMSGIQEHVLSPRGLYYLKWLKVFFFLFQCNLLHSSTTTK